MFTFLRNKFFSLNCSLKLSKLSIASEYFLYSTKDLFCFQIELFDKVKHTIVLVVLSLSINHTILFGKHSQNCYAKIAKTRIFVRIKPLWKRNVWKFNSITNRDVFQVCPQVIDSNDHAKFLFKSHAKSNQTSCCKFAQTVIPR